MKNQAKIIILYPFAIIYGIITGFRNWLFDQEILSSTVFKIPIISVGNLVAGGTVTCTVTINPLAGFTNIVTLSANHLPAGISASFGPASPTNGTSTLTLFASNSVAGGIYALTNSLVVTGNSSLGVRTVPVVLTVKPQPVILTLIKNGSSFVLTGANGFPGAVFYVLGSTEPALPISQWTRMTTNLIDTNGSFSVTNPIDGNRPNAFFILQY